MKSSVLILRFQLSLILASACFFFHSSVAQTGDHQGFVIKYSSEAAQKLPVGQLGSYQGQSVRASQHGGPFGLIGSPANTSLEAIKRSPQIAKLISEGVILDIEPNVSFDLSAWPNDSDIDQQWGLRNLGQAGGVSGCDISAELAWDIQTDGAGIMGLVDTGIDYNHPDLVDNIWQNLAEDADGDGKVLEFINGKWELDPGDLDGIDADNNGYIDDLIGWDFVNDDNNPMDDNGHGTHVGGIIGARGGNGIGGSGVAWTADIMVLKAFNQFGHGSLGNILPALEYARKNGVLLTNNSWGGRDFSKFLNEEVAAARDSGQIFVAASGNTGFYNPFLPIYPASFDVENIISVSATNQRDELTGFSTFGSQRVDIAAPGEQIYSCLPNNSYGRKSGTSMAAGFVSGAVLLMHAHDPSLSMGQLISRILLNAEPINSLYGTNKTNGRLNLLRALQDANNSANSSGLYAAFSGPSSSCVGLPLFFQNISIIPNLAQTSYSWLVNGSEVASTVDLNYSFSTTGWYDVKLILTDNNGSHEYLLPVEITTSAVADLGPDTSLCASAILLDAGEGFQRIKWAKLNCPTLANCVGYEDFTTLDSLKFNSYGGDQGSQEKVYMLTNDQDQILAFSSLANFAPQDSAGVYRLYDLYFYPGMAPSGISVGNLATAIDLTGDNCAIMGMHEFQILDAEFLGNDRFLTAKESGLYILEVEDGCGNIASDTLEITLTGECVWPGDINLDGKVNMMDFLCLGIANQETGPIRPNSTTNWVGQPSPDWSVQFDSANVLASGLNYKYADCNGDGVIDMDADAAIIQNNMGFFHDINISDPGIGPSLHLEHLNTTFSFTGDTAILTVGVYLNGQNDTDVDDFYGIAFNMSFSDPVVQAPLLTPSMDWLGPMKTLGFFTDGNSSAFGSSFLPSNRKSSSFGMVSSNKRSSYGKGLIASTEIIVTIDDIVDDSTEQDVSHFTFSSDHILVIDSIGRGISSASASSMNTVSVDIEWPDSLTNFPLEWLGFQAIQVGEDVELDWQTRSEVNTLQFDIERSADGLMFEKIGTTPARNTSQEVHSYTFADQRVARSRIDKVFYRLKQIDLDGQFSYSKVVSVHLEPSDMGQLICYPNPFDQILTIEYATAIPGSASLRVVNSLGQTMYTSRRLSIEETQKISTVSWPSGVYFVSLESETGQQVLKIFKE